MSTGKPPEKILLTLQLPQQVAARLQSVATQQNRPASEVVIALLDRNLPRADAGKKGKIPYM